MKISFFFSNEWYCIVYMCPVKYPLGWEILDGVYFLDIVNTVAMTIDGRADFCEVECHGI